MSNVHKARFIRHLLEGLDWIHKKRIIHNDIRPDNLLITYENNLVIADFGSALLLPQVTYFANELDCFLIRNLTLQFLYLLLEKDSTIG